MNGSATAFQDVISKLNKVIANYHEGLVRIDREFHAPKKALNADQERNQEVRKSNWKLAFAKEWERNATEIASVSSQIRRHQPAFVDFGGEQPLMVSEIPAGLVMGSLQVSFEQFSCHVPRVISFPFASALVLPQDNLEQKRLAHCLLLRLLSALPPGQIELTLIDSLGRTKSRQHSAY